MYQVRLTDSRAIRHKHTYKWTRLVRTYTQKIRQRKVTFRIHRRPHLKKKHSSPWHGMERLYTLVPPEIRIVVQPYNRGMEGLTTAKLAKEGCV